MLGLAPMLAGALSSGAALRLGLLLDPLPPQAAAMRAVAPRAIAISVLRMWVYLAALIGGAGGG